LSTEDIFRRVVEALERAGIPYMLTGSFASSFHGTPRATQDIDLVIAPTAEQLRRLVRLFPETDYYISEEAALDALGRQGQFNVIDLATGWKIDLIIRKDRAFSRAEFDRRMAAEVFGLRLFIASPEDVVLAKLEWAKAGQSHRQLEDAAGILRARADDLDRPYLERWVAELSLQDEWARAGEIAGV